MNKFSKMKVHWWTYNHCLFVSYLASVAFGYGWISDTKLQKFSNKDWIWIFKIYRIWIRSQKINIRSPLLATDDVKGSSGNTMENVEDEDLKTKICSYRV